MKSYSSLRLLKGKERGISLQNAICEVRCNKKYYFFYKLRNNSELILKNIKRKTAPQLLFNFRIAHWQLLHLIFYYMFLAMNTDNY